MSDNRVGSVAGAVAQRQLMAVNPAHVVPPLILPLIFFAAFAGGLSSLGDIPEFGYPDYTAFIFVFVLFMGASFVGVFRGIAMATDLETGFARRLIAAAPRGISIVLGFVLVALMQSLLVCLVLFGVGALAGMEMGGSILEIAAMIALALLLTVAVMLYSAGVALRLQSVQTGSIFMIMPVFILLFVAPVYLPRKELSGWLEPASGFNPLTALFEAGRGLLIGEPESVALAFGACAAMIVVFFVFAVTSLKDAGAH